MLNNEVTTLRRIDSNPIFKRDFSQLNTDAHNYLSDNEKSIKKNTLTKFDFQSVIDNISLNGKSGVAVIGALITTNNGNYDQLTYYFALCDKNKIIRKFHFDYAPKYISVRTPHPIFHFQYPGEMSPYILRLNLKHDHLDPGLSEPRIFFTPMSLALIINLILKEFSDERTYKASEDRAWRDLVKKNEKDLLAPYFKTCNAFFTKSPGCLFTSDFCYGKE